RVLSTRGRPAESGGVSDRTTERHRTETQADRVLAVQPYAPHVRLEQGPRRETEARPCGGPCHQAERRVVFALPGTAEIVVLLGDPPQARVLVAEREAE